MVQPVLEDDHSFLASRILLDGFNGNLIISGAFRLFKKSVVIAAGGYAMDVLREAMKLAAKVHAYCRSNMERYSIRYKPNVVCWSQAPSTLPDLFKRRRRWHIGLFPCITRYRFLFTNDKDAEKLILRFESMRKARLAGVLFLVCFPWEGVLWMRKDTVKAPARIPA